MPLARLVLVKVLHRLLRVCRAVGLRLIGILLRAFLVAERLLKYVVDIDISRSVKTETAGFGIAAVARRPVTHLLRRSDGRGLHLLVHIPIGEVYALHLLELRLACKARGQEFLFAAHLHERVDRLVLGESKGDDAVGLELARQTGAEHDGALTEVAGCRRGGFCGDDLRAACGAGIGHHEVLVKILALFLCLRALLLRSLDLALVDGLLLLLLGVQTLNLLRRESGAAVFADKILLLGVKGQRCAAARALIIHCSHKYSPLISW